MKTLRFPALPVLIPLVAAVLALNASCALAQDPPPGDPPPAPPGAPAPGAPAPNPGDREAFRQRMNERLKTSLKASDEEWSVIQPLLEKVQAKQRNAMTSRFAFFGGRGGGGRGANDRPDRPGRQSAPEIDALRAALESDATPPAEIKAKLEAVRAMHKKAAAELEQAREELRKVLTLRQEAALVMIGILE